MIAPGSRFLDVCALGPAVACKLAKSLAGATSSQNDARSSSLRSFHASRPVLQSVPTPLPQDNPPPKHPSIETCPFPYCIQNLIANWHPHACSAQECDFSSRFFPPTLILVNMKLLAGRAYADFVPCYSGPGRGHEGGNGRCIDTRSILARMYRLPYGLAAAIGRGTACLVGGSCIGACIQIYVEWWVLVPCAATPRGDSAQGFAAGRPRIRWKSGFEIFFEAFACHSRGRRFQYVPPVVALWAFLILTPLASLPVTEGSEFHSSSWLVNIHLYFPKNYDRRSGSRSRAAWSRGFALKKQPAASEREAGRAPPAHSKIFRRGMEAE